MPAKQFAMPVIKPRTTDGYLALNENPVVVLDRQVRRIDGSQDATIATDGLAITIADLAPDAKERTVYASWKGFLVFARMTDPTKWRAFLMIEDRTRNLFGGTVTGRRLRGGLDSTLGCVTYIELQYLDPVTTRAMVYQLINAAVAEPTTAENQWILQTTVAPSAAEDEHRPTRLGHWLESHSVDDYLDRHLMSDDTLDGLSTAFAAGQRPSAYGLRVNCGDGIGSIIADGPVGTSTHNYRLFIKMWSEYRRPGTRDGALRPMHPGAVLARIAANRSNITFVGDVSSSNNLGIDELLGLTWDETALVPPDPAKQTIHPLIWHLALDREGRQYGVFRLDPATNHVVIAQPPRPGSDPPSWWSTRTIPMSASRSFHDLVAVHSAYTFSSAAEIDALINTATSGTYSNFIDWFQGELRGLPEWLRFVPNLGCCRGNPTLLNVPANARARFNSVWDHIPELFGTPMINLVQFATVASMIIRETGGSFRPPQEGGNLAYLFAYNHRPSLNWTAQRLFSDPLFLFAHGTLLPGPTLAHTTDPLWAGSAYPEGYATAADDPSVAFIAQADFNKFRGYGYIQSTGRSHFRKLARFVLDYTGTSVPIIAVRARWQGALAAATAAGIPIAPNETDAVLTLSTESDWSNLLQAPGLEFACAVFRLFFQTSPTRQLLDYAPSTDPLSYVWRVSDHVSGAVCSIEANLLRVHSMLTKLVDG